MNLNCPFRLKLPMAFLMKYSSRRNKNNNL